MGRWRRLDLGCAFLAGDEAPEGGRSCRSRSGSWASTPACRAAPIISGWHDGWQYAQSERPLSSRRRPKARLPPLFLPPGPTYDWPSRPRRERPRLPPPPPPLPLIIEMRPPRTS